MRKLLFLFLAIMGITLTACSSDDKDSAISSVSLVKAYISENLHDATINIDVKNATDDMEFTLYYGPAVSNVELSTLSSTKMDFDKAKQRLTTVLKDIDMKQSLYGTLVVKDTKTNESRRFTDPILIHLAMNFSAN